MTEPREQVNENLWYKVKSGAMVMLVLVRGHVQLRVGDLVLVPHRSIRVRATGCPFEQSIAKVENAAVKRQEHVMRREWRMEARERMADGGR